MSALAPMRRKSVRECDAIVLEESGRDVVMENDVSSYEEPFCGLVVFSSGKCGEYFHGVGASRLPRVFSVFKLRHIKLEIERMLDENEKYVTKKQANLYSELLLHTLWQPYRGERVGARVRLQKALDRYAKIVEKGMRMMEAQRRRVAMKRGAKLAAATLKANAPSPDQVSDFFRGFVSILETDSTLIGTYYSGKTEELSYFKTIQFEQYKLSPYMTMEKTDAGLLWERNYPVDWSDEDVQDGYYRYMAAHSG